MESYLVDVQEPLAAAVAAAAATASATATTAGSGGGSGGGRGVDSPAVGAAALSLPSEINCSAFMFGNITALVNDPRPAAFSRPCSAGGASGGWRDLVNCHIYEVSVGGFKVPFLCTTKDVAPGEASI